MVACARRRWGRSGLTRQSPRKRRSTSSGSSRSGSPARRRMSDGVPQASLAVRANDARDRAGAAPAPPRSASAGPPQRLRRSARGSSPARPAPCRRRPPRAAAPAPSRGSRSPPSPPCPGLRGRPPAARLGRSLQSAPSPAARGAPPASSRPAEYSALLTCSAKRREARRAEGLRVPRAHGRAREVGVDQRLQLGALAALGHALEPLARVGVPRPCCGPRRTAREGCVRPPWLSPKYRRRPRAARRTGRGSAAAILWTLASLTPARSAASAADRSAKT